MSDKSNLENLLLDEVLVAIGKKVAVSRQDQERSRGNNGGSGKTSSRYLLIIADS